MSYKCLTLIANISLIAAFASAFAILFNIFVRDGTRLGKIFVPEVCTNLTFGGKEKNRLFITGENCLYAIYLNTEGVQTP